MGWTPSLLADVGGPIPSVANYWFLGSGGATTITGYFLDSQGNRTGASFTQSINQANGTNLPISLASVSGGIPQDPNAFDPNNLPVAMPAALTLVSVTNANPAVVTTSAAHGMVNGQQVTHGAPTLFGGNNALNGTFYVKNLTSTTYSIFDDPALLDGVDATGGVWTSGGSIQPLPIQPRAAIGAILRFSGKTFFDIGVSPGADFITNYANYPFYSASDGNVPIARVEIL